MKPQLTDITYPTFCKLKIGRFIYTYSASQFQITRLQKQLGKRGWKVFNEFKKQSDLIKKEVINYDT